MSFILCYVRFCISFLFFFIFFFKQKTAYEMRISDWSSDVCSSDLQIEARQLAFARQLSGAVAARTKTVEAAIRGFGLKPNAMLRRTRSAQGGPFIPYKSPDGIDPQFYQLNKALDRLDRLENTLLAIPYGRPTTIVMLSSREEPRVGQECIIRGSTQCA